MAFTRKALAALGLNEDQVEKVMTLHGTSMADFIPRSELQGKIDSAVEAAKNNMSIDDITKSDEYQKILAERDMFKLLGGKDFASVKPAFREFIYDKLQKGDGAPAIDEQLKSLAEELGECFQENVTKDPQPQQTFPQFAADTDGSVPTGINDTVSKLASIWGYSK